MSDETKQERQEEQSEYGKLRDTMTAALLGGNEINIAGAMVTPVGFRVIEFGEGKAHVTVDFLVSSKCEDERRGRIARRIHDEPS